jgi:hypothetical protein
VADRELTRQPVDQIQADRKGDVDANQIDDAGVVGIDEQVADPVLEQLVEHQQDADREDDGEPLPSQTHAGVRLSPPSPSP